MQGNDKRAAKKSEGETEILEAIATMPEADRAIGERLHAIVTSTAPDLMPRTWYGMPAYTIKTGGHGDKIVCFFRTYRLKNRRGKDEYIGGLRT